ncbi:MAG: hypothetical protein RML12_11090 [Xanthomonadales bacterium]|nr:hypothetical protein [Xanthomonadales bacterium]
MRRLALLALLALLPLFARAFTPESGFWWTPTEPGSGIAIEIQDNYLFLAAYAYRPDGSATFYTSQGTLSGNARFVGELLTFRGGTCIGCPWTPNVTIPNQGTVEIIFQTERTGRLRWGGRDLPIERFLYYLKRPADPAAAPLEVTKLLGEWSMVLDFERNPEPGLSGFQGEVLVFDRVVFDNRLNAWVFDGCRADDSEIGACLPGSLDAAGTYDPRIRRHVIVVYDGRDSLNRDVCLYYELDVGTNQLRTLRLDGIGGVAVYLCEREDPLSRRFHPVRGFRTASRTFVQGGVGPSEAKAAPARPSRFELAAPPDAAGARDEGRQALRRALEARLARPEP